MSNTLRYAIQYKSDRKWITCARFMSLWDVRDYINAQVPGSLVRLTIGGKIILTHFVTTTAPPLGIEFIAQAVNEKL